MGGVDKIDQQLQGIHVLRKTYKWYHKIFFRLPMVSLLNAHKLYERRGGKSDFLQYIHDVSVTLLQNAPHLRNQPRRPPNDSLIRLTGRHFSEQIKYKGQNQKKKHGENKCKVCCARGHKTNKINITLPALLPNKIPGYSRGPVTSSDKIGQDKLRSRNKRAIPLLAIAQGTTAIGDMLIKGINALVDANRASSFYNVIKMPHTNVEITHNRLVTLENRTSMMVKAIMPALKDLKLQINKTNKQLASHTE